MQRPSPRGTALALLCLVSAAALSQTPTPQPPGGSQTSKLEAGPFSVPLRIEEAYLGRSGEKTAIRFTLSLLRTDLRLAGATQPRVYSFMLSAEVRRNGEGPVSETFKVPVDVDLSEADPSKPVSATFLQALYPGKQSIQFWLDAVGGKRIASKAVALDVPVMQGDFRVEAAGETTAAAIILEASNREAVPLGIDLVKILAPTKEVPIGLIRVECDVKPPVTRVEFFLDEKKILVRNRAPYTVELDLGKIPRRQTLKALGFDSQGNFIDADAWAINERDARLAVRILELPAKVGAAPGDKLDVKVSVQSIAGGTLKSLQLFLDDEKVATWTAPPYTAALDRAKVKKATLMRASAFDENGKEFADIKLLKGEARFVSSAEVNLVELNVSVLDSENRFRKDLKKDDFTVLEDGVRQELQAFEFAESLPLSIGIAIDGSGSMKESMPLVHQAASEFITKLFREKDQGFVMEFREVPTLLAPMSKRTADVIRGITETRAIGATSLYDSIVMSLYQFRAVPGKKALVILSDGKDNHSWTEYETLRRYARTSNVPLYFIGLEISFLEVGLKSKLNELAADTGGEAFYPKNAKALPEIYSKIETELRSQYFLTYLTSSQKPPEEFRAVEVKLKDPKLRAKTIRGFFP